MLRASVETTNASLDPKAITDPDVDPLVPGGSELIALVDAVISRNNEAVTAARAEVIAGIGPAGLVDAAGVLGNFEMMNRIADATGTPVAKGTLARTEKWRQATGIDRLFPQPGARD